MGVPVERLVIHRKSEAPPRLPVRSGPKKDQRSRTKNTSADRTSQESDQKLSVYDGRVWLGDIQPNGRRFDAFGVIPLYHFIGRFPTLRTAADAVSAAYGARP